MIDRPRTLWALAALAALCSCGEDRRPLDPYGVSRYGGGLGGSAVPLAATVADASAPPPSVGAPASAGASPPAASPTPNPTPSPTETPRAPTPAMKGGYKVEPVVGGATIRGICRIQAPGGWTIKADKDLDKGCGPMGERATERVVVGPGNALANCVVYLRVVKKGKDFPEAMRSEDRTFKIDQKTCRYAPHVAWMRTGTQASIGNSDGADHNMHAYFLNMSESAFNVTSRPHSVDDDTAHFDKAGMYVFKCDIHPWMSGNLFVAAHPYYDATSAEATEGKAPGEFLLTDVPPGDYDLVCWHEGMEEVPVVVDGKIATYNHGSDFETVTKVTVAAGEKKTVDFEIPAPPENGGRPK